MEKELHLSGNMEDTVRRIIANYSTYRRSGNSATFADVYQLYYDDKYMNTKKEFSASSKNSTRSAYLNCSKLHDKPFKEITLADLQSVIDNCPLKHASLELIKNLYRGMYQYAVPHGITDKDFSKYVKINVPDDDDHGQPFTEEDILKLWKNRDDITCRRILVMCYSGYRVSAYKSLTITADYFKGGIKTKSGKGRIVPIHPAIRNLVGGCDFENLSPQNLRYRMPKTLSNLVISEHTPHDCRHTFSMLCDKYGVNPIAKKKLLGHSLAGDMSNGVYGHWDYDMLRPEVDKIQVPWEFY